MFPGSFDPIHSGHLQAGLEKLSALDLLLFIPIKNNPHKKLKANFSQRCQMIDLAILDLVKNHQYQANQLRLKKIKNNKKYNFGLAEIQNIVLEYPEYQPFILIGEDNVNSFQKWQNYTKIIKLAPPIILNHVKNADKKISSSDIKLGLNSAGHLLPEQATYIAKNKLYPL